MTRQYTDKEIIKSIQSNFELDILAFMFHRLYDRIVTHVTNNSGQKEQAFGVLQEALVLLYKKIKAGKYDPTYDIDGFLLANCRKIWINRAKLNRGNYLYGDTNLTAEDQRFFFLLNPESEKDIINIKSFFPEEDYQLLLDVCFHNKELSKLLVQYHLNLAEDLDKKIAELKSQLIQKINESIPDVTELDQTVLVDSFLLNAGLLFVKNQVDKVVNQRPELDLGNKKLWVILASIIGLGLIIVFFVSGNKQRKDNIANDIGEESTQSIAVQIDTSSVDSSILDMIVNDSVIIDTTLAQEEAVQLCDTINIKADIIIQPSCSDKHDGSIKFTNITSNGKKPYWTSIDNGMSFSLITTYNNVAPGSYRLMIQEGNECFGRVGTKTVPSVDCPETDLPDLDSIDSTSVDSSATN